MATLNDSTFREGQSTTRSSFFDDNDYTYWKTRMRIYLQALDYEIWEVVCDGPFMPMFKDEVGDDIPKPSSQWMNTLRALGKTFSNSEKVKKIIRPLPEEWRPKRTAIEEATNLNTLPLDDLISSLISYEEDLVAEKRDEEKKKNIALKASKYESDGESESDDEELAMLARRFRIFFKKTGERRKFRSFKNQREKKEVITCYECKKPDHIRSECPLINKLKKKAMVATWDDSEEDSSDEKGLQEVSNLALMAIRDDNDLNEIQISPNSSMAERPQRRARTKHTAPRRSSPSRPPSQDFESLNFSNDTSAQQFRDKFMGKPVTPSFSLNITEFSDITNCGGNITQMLSHWNEALSIEEPIYENLVRVFYSNMELSSSRRVELYTSVGGVRIAFNESTLCSILGISYGGLDIYTARKELAFSDFCHVDGVWNICRRRDLSDDICSLSFRQGHTDEVTRLDVGLLDSLIRRRHVSLSYTILCHMLSTPKVTNRSLPYGSIITKILKFFTVPINKPVYLETQKLGREIISTIGFFKKRGKWEKTTSSKNGDTLLTLDDDRMLNDVYSEDELPDFCLGARPRVPRRAAAAPVAASVATSSQDDEPAVPLAASTIPVDHIQ
ncbi:Integrase catalytic domain-containing protein [Citrus sinensis]|nr:Integrase catalytic domain-containing protein [Citrus sinensis]